MIKKSITYTDIDDRTVTEDFYFNLTKAEMLELEVSVAGGWRESMQFLVDSKDSKAILGVIKQLILKAYGQRGSESRHFIKRPEDADAFSHTEAFSNMFMEFFEKSDVAAQFFEALMPKDLVAEAKAERLKPQDYQQKAEPAFRPVKDVELPLEPAPERMTLPIFQQLSPEDQQVFISKGGKLDVEL